ncbi:hypothetical protein ACA910_022685 [Epithemia clementina (nom. ined.)]
MDISEIRHGKTFTLPSAPATDRPRTNVTTSGFVATAANSFYYPTTVKIEPTAENQLRLRTSDVSFPPVPSTVSARTVDGMKLDSITAQHSVTAAMREARRTNTAESPSSDDDHAGSDDLESPVGALSSDSGYDTVSSRFMDENPSASADATAIPPPQQRQQQQQGQKQAPNRSNYSSLEIAGATAAKSTLEDPRIRVSSSTDRIDTDLMDEDEIGFQQEKARNMKDNSDLPLGEADLDEDDYGEATWEEVCQSCCCHTPEEWLWIGVAIFGVIVFLYFFLFGLELLSSGAKVMSGCRAGDLFGDDANPIAAVMIGLLATVLMQSSSATTSIIVSLVGDDQGSGTISVAQGIYMVMGANIGTSITNTIVALGFSNHGEQLERAFAGATVHDMFNFMTVGVMFPLEVMTGFLEKLTQAMTKHAQTKNDDDWEGPIKHLVAPLGRQIIIPNKKIAQQIASGEHSCDYFYPMNCPYGASYKSCGGEFGLIACDSEKNFCPAFFSVDATPEDDKVSGGVVFFLAIFILFFCLLALVANLQKLLLGVSTRIVYKATDVNGYIAIMIGAGITMLVQSSSITTSTLTPLVGIGALRVEQMYPLTLGANIGTTVTGLTAAMVSDNIESLQVALAHLFFNVFGVLIWYPIPFMRSIPRYAAQQLGKGTRLWRGFPLVYIAVMFFLVPLVFLGLSALFEKDSKGLTVLGAFLVSILGITLIWLFYWCQCQNGREVCALCFKARERRRVALQDLPDTLDYMMDKISALIEHTGLPDDDENDDQSKPLTSETGHD